MNSDNNLILKSLRLENFKCFSDPVTIDFAPITMLYGPNSAGKSSVIQAICYLSEILNGNLDADITTHGGSEMNLGGFQNLLYNRDLDKTIKIGVELNLSNLDIKDYLFFDLGLEYKKYKKVLVEFEIAYSRYEEKPYVASIKYTYDDDFKFALFASADLAKWSISLHSHEISDSHLEILENEDVDMKYFDIDIDDLFEDMDINKDTYFIDVDSKNKLGALPRIKKDDYLRIFEVDENDNISLSDFEGENNIFYNENDEKNKKISNVVHIPLNILRVLTNQFRFIGPIRKIPPRHFMPQKSKYQNRWADGMAAWDALQSLSKEEMKTLNEFMGDEFLNSGYRIELRKYSVADTRKIDALLNGDIIQSPQEKFGYEFEKIFLIDNKTEIEVQPHDIGVGISQILPCIVAMIHDIGNEEFVKIIAIEQPELHIHPKMQVELGDVLIDRAKNEGLPLFIETHSEHLLLRLLKRIRQQTNEEVPPGKIGITPNDLSVLYINPANGEDINATQIYKLRVNEEGEFINRWPAGFFAERGVELFE